MRACQASAVRLDQLDQLVGLAGLDLEPERFEQLDDLLVIDDAAQPAVQLRSSGAGVSGDAKKANHSSMSRLG